MLRSLNASALAVVLVLTAPAFAETYSCQSDQNPSQKVNLDVTADAIQIADASAEDAEPLTYVNPLLLMDSANHEAVVTDAQFDGGGYGQRGMGWGGRRGMGFGGANDFGGGRPCDQMRGPSGVPMRPHLGHGVGGNLKGGGKYPHLMRRMNPCM